MKNILTGFVVLSLFLTGALPVRAQEKPALPKEMVEELSRKAHEALPEAKIGKDETIGKERAATLVYPLIPYEDRESTIVRGHISAFAKWCGLQWDTLYFFPYMKMMRLTHPDWTAYQFAYVGLLHGLSMGMMLKAKEGKTCSAEEKAHWSSLASEQF